MPAKAIPWSAITGCRLARRFAGLEPAEHVGRIAAERVLRRLGARKVETQKVPVVFEPRTARSLLDNIFEAVHGESIYRHASFLAGKLGEKVAAETLTVIDDGTLPGLFGSSPFDDEGVPSRRTAVIERGVLKSYLLNTYAARKLGMKTTGNASRGITGNAGIGHGNLFIWKMATARRTRSLPASTDGFYVTELIGFGVNIVTGDYSRGAAGLVDSQRRAGVPSVRSYHRRKFEEDVDGDGNHRFGPGVSRIDCRSYADDRGDDRWRPVKQTLSAVPKLKKPASPSPFPWWWAPLS